jgi:hypothetical protein
MSDPNLLRRAGNMFKKYGNKELDLETLIESGILLDLDYLLDPDSGGVKKDELWKITNTLKDMMDIAELMGNREDLKLLGKNTTEQLLAGALEGMIKGDLDAEKLKLLRRALNVNGIIDKLSSRFPDVSKDNLGTMVLNVIDEQTLDAGNINPDYAQYLIENIIRQNPELAANDKSTGFEEDTGIGFGCNWQIVPDQVRVYPFKYPDLFSNQNFCNTNDPNYPSNCNFSDQYDADVKIKAGTDNQLTYANNLNEYYDPAQLQRSYNQSPSFQVEKRDTIQGERAGMLRMAEAAPVNSPNDAINCENCGGQSLKTALVKIVNATARNDSFMRNYLGTNGVNMTCDTGGGDLSAIADRVIATSANMNVGANGSYIEHAATGQIHFWQACLWHVPGTGWTPGVWIPFGALAKIRYWVVMPYGHEIENIEQQLLGTFYLQKEYEQFMTDDARFNRRLQISGAAADVPLYMPGAGPISNIFMVQQSLYRSNSPIYKAFASCGSINGYFRGDCSIVDGAENASTQGQVDCCNYNTCRSDRGTIENWGKQCAGENMTPAEQTACLNALVSDPAYERYKQATERYETNKCTGVLDKCSAASMSQCGGGGTSSNGGGSGNEGGGGEGGGESSSGGGTGTSGGGGNSGQGDGGEAQNGDGGYSF